MGVLARQQETLVAENDRLLAELEREERALTDARKTMTSEEFAPLAAAFDQKANSIRATQEAKARDLAKALETARFRFFREIEPVIIKIMQDRGVSVLLTEQAVMLSASEADITAAVLERLDVLHSIGELGQRD